MYRAGPSLVFVSVTSPTQIAFGYYTRDVGIILSRARRLPVARARHAIPVLTVYRARGALSHNGGLVYGRPLRGS